MRYATLLACLSGFLLSPLSAAEPPLRWGADAEGGAPFIFKNPDNLAENIGFEVELAEAFAAEIGREIQFKQYPYESLVPGLERGDIDVIMNGLEITPDRLEGLRMSKPYYIYTLQLVARTDEKRFTSLEQIKALKLKVGTLNDTAASRLLAEMEIDCTQYDGQAEPYEDLELGRTDAVLMDLPIALYYARPRKKLKFVGETFGEGGYGLAFRPRDAALAEQFDAAIIKLRDSGELERIYRKWGLWTEEQRGIGRENALPAPGGSGKFTIDKYLPLLLDGAQVTILLSILSMAVAMAIGLLVAVLRLYGPWPVRLLAISYVEFFRGIPVLLLLYFLYYGLPKVLAQFGIIWNLDAFTAGIMAFGLNYAAYEAEIYRAGIGSIPVGQWEAAATLGMNKFTTFRRIILPQTWRVVLPPMTNDFVALFKDTSVISVITVVELTKQYLILSKSSLKYVEIGLVTAALYLIMSVPLGYLSRWMEKRLAKG